MRAAINQFETNFRAIRDMHHLFETLTTANPTQDLSDLLRFELMYAVSAFDKLIHELVKFGMLECFSGLREKTDAFKTFKISTASLEAISQAKLDQQTASSIILPNQTPEYFFQLEIDLHGKNASYQNSSNVSKGLTLFWNENDKWGKIAEAVYNDKNKKSEIIDILNAISAKRHLIVHEADINPVDGNKNLRDSADTTEDVNFLEKLGKEIYECVKLQTP